MCAPSLFLAFLATKCGHIKINEEINATCKTFSTVAYPKMSKIDHCALQINFLSFGSHIRRVYFLRCFVQYIIAAAAAAEGSKNLSLQALASWNRVSKKLSAFISSLWLMPLKLRSREIAVVAKMYCIKYEQTLFVLPRWGTPSIFLLYCSKSILWAIDISSLWVILARS